MTAFEAELRQLTLDAISKIMGKEEPLPTELFHYTHEAALVEILSSRYVWLTHQEFLSDPSETEHARTLALQLVNERFRADESARSTFCQRITGAEIVGPRDFHVDGYVASFSATRDSLSQWRAYANNGRGYCIGLDPRGTGYGQLLQSFDAGTAFWRVLYRENDFRHRLTLFFDKGMELAQDAERDGVIRQAALNRLGNWLQILVQLSRRVCKQPGYAEEAEWRLVHVRRRRGMPFLLPDINNVSFRPAKGQIVPYVSLPLSVDEHLPLRSVLIGPAAVEQERELALRMFLTSKGYDGVQLVGRSATQHRI